MQSRTFRYRSTKDGDRAVRNGMEPSFGLDVSAVVEIVISVMVALMICGVSIYCGLVLVKKVKRRMKGKDEGKKEGAVEMGLQRCEEKGGDATVCGA